MSFWEDELKSVNTAYKNNANKVGNSPSFLQNVLGAAASSGGINLDSLLGAAIGVGIKGALEKGNDKKADEANKANLAKMGIGTNAAPEGGEVAEPGLLNPGLANQTSSNVSILNNPSAVLHGQSENLAQDMVVQRSQVANQQAAQAAQGLLAKQGQLAQQKNQQLQQAVAQQEAEKAKQQQQLLSLGMALATGGIGGEALAGEAVADDLAKKKIMQGVGANGRTRTPVNFSEGASAKSLADVPIPYLTSTQRRGLREIADLKEQYQQFQSAYDNAEDEESAAEAQKGMADVARRAEVARANYKKAGVDLDSLASAAQTHEDVINLLEQDKIRKYDQFTNGDMSSDQYYYKMVDELKARGMSTRRAQEYAREYAARYQADLISRQTNMLRDFGLDGDAVNQLGAFALAELARTNPKGAQVLMSQFASPKDSWNQEMQMRQREHAASIQQALRNAVGGRGSGAGRSVTGSNGGSSNEPFDGTDYSANDYYSFIDSNVLPIKERNSRLAEIDKRLSKVERDEDGYFNYSPGDKADLRERWFIHNRMDRMPRNSKEAWQWLTTMQEEALDGNRDKLFSNEKIAEYVEVWLGRYKAAGLEAYDGEAEDIYSAAVNGTQSDGRAAERAEQQRQQEEENRQRNGLAEYVSNNPGEQLSDDELSQYNTTQKANDELANKWTNKSVPTEQELSDEEKIRLWNQYIGR